MDPDQFENPFRTLTDGRIVTEMPGGQWVVHMERTQAGDCVHVAEMHVPDGVISGETMRKFLWSPDNDAMAILSYGDSGYHGSERISKDLARPIWKNMLANGWKWSGRGVTLDPVSITTQPLHIRNIYNLLTGSSA